ncbi:lipoprotein insertase outer membrane protein LolB [Vibrio hepatarius]|uniref:lipoprotein insertase outer membrane protein LolB n=1 Tax=Vibrio hepatarius TaxID=171383 RepID=UPI00142D3075|nr:lipoprotein insertase outer membrane protein LolB [Vibrio hepatarius]NIY82283.1 lipoprotein localization protein LolB [Vibrio hepatarius]
MKTNFRPLWLIGLISIVLSGCANIEPSTTNVEWDTHQQRLDSIAQYKANGKLGYISPEQRQSLNFQWQHAPRSSQLRLTTFLGQTALNLTITPAGAFVETYDDQSYASPNAETLIQQLTGLTIPVEQLSDWLLGDPTGADSYQLNDTNTVATLNKQINGQRWELEYIKYTDVQLSGVSIPLPQKLKLKQQDISINIVISNWDLN